MREKWRRFGPIRERAVRYPLVTLPLLAGLIAFGFSLILPATKGLAFAWVVLVLFTGGASDALAAAVPALARSLAWGVAAWGVVFVGCLTYRWLRRASAKSPPSTGLGDDVLE